MKLSRKFKSLFWLLLVFSAALLTWIGLSQHYPETNTLRYLPDRLFRIVKTLTGNDPAGPSVEPLNIPLALIFAKLCVTLILLGALYKVVEKVFNEQYTLLRAMLKRHHSIVIGAGDKGQALLQSLQAQTGKTAVVIEQRADSKNLGRIRKDGHIALIGNATDEDTLLAAGALRAERLICFSTDENNGIEIAARLGAIYAQRQPDNHLCCHIHLDNPRLVYVFQRNNLAQREHGFEIRFFNWHTLLARRFFHQLAHSLGARLQIPGAHFAIHLLGYGDTAIALLLQGLRVFHPLPGQSVAWHVHSPNAERHAQAFAEQYPQAQHIAPIHFHEHDGRLAPEFGPEQAAQQNLVICASADSRRNLNLAAEILNATPGADFPVHVHGNSRRIAPLLAASARERLHFFGDDSEVCNYELITGQRQDRLAQAIHADYLGQLGQLQERSASESAAYQSAWDELTEDAKAANRAQADHIIYKLALSGKSLSQLPQFSDSEIEALAQAEHQRWAAHRYLNGWQYGASRDDATKRHPSLIAWEQLSEAEKQKDRDTVQRIPHLLRSIGLENL